MMLLLISAPFAAGQLPGLPGFGGNTSGAEDTPDGPGAPPEGTQSSNDDQPVEEEVVNLLDQANLDSLIAENSYRQWGVLFLCILAGLTAGKVLQFTCRKIGARFEQRAKPVRSHLFHDAASPLSLLALTVGLAAGLFQLDMPEAVETFTGKIIRLLVSIAIFWFGYNLISIVEIFLQRLTSKTSSSLDDMVVPLIRKAARIFLVILAVLFILDGIFEADIGAFLAGLGIAGLAVSLAAQDSLKHLFGSITIFLDRPFLVGSFIKFGEDVGTIEEIGFRSSRLRTLDGHLITIPNGNIINGAVTNIGVRPYIRRVLNVTVTYDTPPEKMQQAIDILREICQQEGIRENIHDPDEPDNPDRYPPRIYFNDFNAASLNIIVYYWFRPGEWWPYMEHANRFNHELLRRFNEAGIEFAFPTQTLYLAGDQKRPLNVGIENSASRE